MGTILDTVFTIIGIIAAVFWMIAVVGVLITIAEYLEDKNED